MACSVKRIHPTHNFRDKPTGNNAIKGYPHWRRQLFCLPGGRGRNVSQQLYSLMIVWCAIDCCSCGACEHVSDTNRPIMEPYSVFGPLCGLYAYVYCYAWTDVLC